MVSSHEVGVHREKDLGDLLTETWVCCAENLVGFIAQR